MASRVSTARTLQGRAFEIVMDHGSSRRGRLLTDECLSVRRCAQITDQQKHRLRRKKLACSLSIKQQAHPPHIKIRAKMGKGGRHSSMMSRIRVGFMDDIRGCGMTIQVATRLRPLLLNPRANSKKVYYNYYTYCNPNSASNHIWI